MIPLSPFVEYKQVRQEPGPGRRRWFQSPQGDLMVWYDAHGVVTGLQFCHTEGVRERVYTWRTGMDGWRQQVVDEGTRPPMMAMSPILVAVPPVSLDGLCERLRAGLPGLELELAAVVEAVMPAAGRKSAGGDGPIRA